MPFNLLRSGLVHSKTGIEIYSELRSPRHMYRFAQPAVFSRLSQRFFPWIAVCAAVMMAIGVYQALFIVPADYQQGDTVRIMYVHVPAAWMAVMIYSIMAACSAAFLIWKHTLADVIARASAPIGCAFTAITLVTGALWGKPMWGAWWVWDARLTSVLILQFLYIGYMALEGGFESPERERKSLAVLALVGFVNIPVIKFSVEWWNTLHQPASLLRLNGPAIHGSMLWPLLVMIAGFMLFYAALALLRARTLLIEAKIQRLQMRAL